MSEFEKEERKWIKVVKTAGGHNARKAPTKDYATVNKKSDALMLRLINRAKAKKADLYLSDNGNDKGIDIGIIIANEGEYTLSGGGGKDRKLGHNVRISCARILAKIKARPGNYDLVRGSIEGKEAFIFTIFPNKE